MTDARDAQGSGGCECRAGSPVIGTCPVCRIGESFGVACAIDRELLVVSLLSPAWS